MCKTAAYSHSLMNFSARFTLVFIIEMPRVKYFTPDLRYRQIKGEKEAV